MTRVYLVVVTDDRGESLTNVCATRDEDIAKELAERAGGHVESVLLIDPETD
jgi:hypothetical protein